MNIKGNEDLRVQKTISSIKEAFKKLIIEKDFEKMDVKEVCQIALINPKTFYHYYGSLDDLLMEIHMDATNDFLKILSKYKIPDELKEFNEEFFADLSNRGESYEKIMMSGNFGYIKFKTLEKILNNLYDDYDVYKNMDSFEKGVIINYINTTILDVYRRWIDSGKMEPLSNVVDLSYNLMRYGVNGFLGKEE